MKRYKMSKFKSKRNFRRGAANVSATNNVRPMRGGFRI